jgi:O-antigen/teichoic acid export membrane protein
MLGIVFFSLFSIEIVKILSKNTGLWSASYIVPILSFSILFINMKEITVYGLHIVRKTKIIGIIVLVTSVLSLLLNILLIPVWDITGCALATLISQAIYWALVLFYSQKHFYIPYELRKIIIMIVTGVLISLIPIAINDLSLVYRLIIKSLLFLSFPFILYFLRFYEQAELDAISGFIKKWSKPGQLRENLRSLRNIREDYIES